MKIGKKYSIMWLDTFSFNGWYDKEDLEEKTKDMTYLQESCGFLAYENKDWVVLATHENPHKSFAKWGHPDWIPKGVIKKIKEIK